MTHPTTFAPRDNTANAGEFYRRMPVGFGPYPGPRQIPHPGQRELSTSRRTVATVTYSTEWDAIKELLPPCFTPGAVPTVTLEVQKLENLDWLAGRGYSTLGVKFPAIFTSATGDIEGDFLAVLWENLADPIISGREELGFAKLWCDIDETAEGTDEMKYSGSWLGHHFVEMELTGLREATTPAPARRPLLHYKYFPKTGCPGEADAAYPVMTPTENPHLVVDRRLTAEGRFTFRESAWQDLPTLFHIVNPLSRLPLKEFCSASLVYSHGGKDLSDQTILT
jgi:hypothetical protein